jgi:hypothetical protein
VRIDAFPPPPAAPPCGPCNGTGIAYDWYDGVLEGWCYEPCAVCGGKGRREPTPTMEMAA